MLYEDRITRLDTLVVEGRITRRAWTGVDADGRETACLLAALSPEAGAAHDASACPAEVMPAWLAELTPSINDNISAAAWPDIVRRYAALAHRWHVLDDAAWRRAEAGTMLEILAVAQPHDDSGVVERMTTLWQRVRGGDEPSTEEWAAAEASVDAADAEIVAAWEYARIVAQPAHWATWASRAAARADARVAAWAATLAADWMYTRIAAWDRIAGAVLDALESECLA